MKQLSKYEQVILAKLGESIQSGKWSNNGLVQIIELCAEYLNLLTLSECARLNNITYNGAKKRNLTRKIIGINFVIDNT
jgi:hypothetical protein